MGTTLHQGWAILTFLDKPPLAGRLRYEQVGVLYQWVLDIPACHHHAGCTAIVDPLCVKSVTPCDEREAVDFAQRPAPLRGAGDVTPAPVASPVAFHPPAA